MTQRVRLTYAKTEPLRYTGHLDLYRVWERTLRRSRLPISYSQGFHPQAKVHMASALPLGFTSLQEIIDVWMDEDIPLETVESTIRRTVPPGIEIQSSELVDLRAPAIQTQVASSEYVLNVLDSVEPEELSQRVADLLAAESLIREWRKKSYDLRPLIEAITILPPTESGNQQLIIRLSAREGATGRPEEVVAALGLNPFSVRVVRTRLVMTP